MECPLPGPSLPLLAVWMPPCPPPCCSLHHSLSPRQCTPPHTLSWNARASPTADCPLSLVPQLPSLLTHPGPQPSSSSGPPNGPPWCASPGTREIPGRGPHRKGLSMSVPTLPLLCIAPNDNSPLLLKLKMALGGEMQWRAHQLCLSHPPCETGEAHVFRASVLFRAAHLALSTCRLTVLTVVVIIPPSSQGGP